MIESQNADNVFIELGRRRSVSEHNVPQLRIPYCTVHVNLHQSWPLDLSISLKMGEVASCISYVFATV